MFCCQKSFVAGYRAFPLAVLLVCRSSCARSRTSRPQWNVEYHNRFPRSASHFDMKTGVHIITNNCSSPSAPARWCRKHLSRVTLRLSTDVAFELLQRFGESQVEPSVVLTDLSKATQGRAARGHPTTRPETHHLQVGGTAGPQLPPQNFTFNVKTPVRVDRT